MSNQKVAIVSGANRGIGKEIVKQLIANNFKVVATGRSHDTLKELSNELNANLSTVVVDVSKDESCERFASYLNENYSKIDVLINNAGIMGTSSMSAFDLTQIEKVMNTNFYGAIRLSKAVFPLLKKSEDARIINVSSEMGALSNLSGSHAAYRLSKWALNGFTMLLANDIHAGNIKINAICPGWCQTDMGGKGATRTASQGAETAVWLATEKVVGNGNFYSNKKEIAW